MSDYSMNISGNIELSDYSNIFDYLNIIDTEDNFMIKINKDNKNDIDLINTMLRDNEFTINYEGYDHLGNYCIKANKFR